MIFFVLVRKLLRDMRWSLGIPVLAFLGITVLSVWLATRFERIMAEPEPPEGRAMRGLGIARGLGGPAQDFSTIGLEVFWWNHPFIILTVVGWAIARGSSAFAGEIDRGTMDLTLSRPISRTTYLCAQIAVGILGLFMLAGSLAVGTYVAGKFFTLTAPPSLLHLCRPATIVFALGLSIFGYTLPLSAIDSVRWRPGLIALGITLLGVIAMSMAPLFKGYDWLENLSVFKLYAPVTVAIKGEPLWYNTRVLASVFLGGAVLAFGAFLWRDMPAGGA
jgi:ABC-2 type transport system permease protein